MPLIPGIGKHHPVSGQKWGSATKVNVGARFMKGSAKKQVCIVGLYCHSHFISCF